MTTVALAPVARQLFLNPSTGAPASGFRLFVYEAGTTTKATTYTDSTGDTPNTDPIILDTLGECDIWLVPGTAYKFVFSPPTDTDPPTNAIWTVDGISTSSGSGGAGSVSGFPTTAALLSAFAAGVSLDDGTIAVTAGRDAEGDGGGSTFYYNSADHTTADNGGTIRVDPAARRWYSTAETVTPNLFGAKGDGTTNDAGAINSALAVGLDIYFPPEYSYSAHSPLICSTNYQRLTGGATITTAAGVASVFSATSLTGVVFSGLRCVAGLSNDADTILLTTCTHCVVEDCDLSGYGGSGVHLTVGCSKCDVKNNRFTGAAVDTRWGMPKASDVLADTSNDHCTISGNHFSSAGGFAINVTTRANGDHNDHHTITGNTIDGYNTYGIVLYRNADTAPDAALQSVFGCTVTGNTVRNISGIRPLDPAVPATLNAGAGIYNQGAENTTIAGNTISNTNTSTNSSLLAPGGIGIGSTGVVAVTGNTISVAKIHGIAVNDANSLAATVGFLTITGNTISNATQAGVSLDGQSNVSVVGNTIDTTGTSCIRQISTATSNMNISGNSLRHATSSGVSIEAGVTDLNVTGNNVSACTVAGIIVGLSEAHISGNRVSGCGTGIRTNSNNLTPSSIIANTVSACTTAIVALAPTAVLDNIIDGATTDYSGVNAPFGLLDGTATPDVAYRSVTVSTPSGALTITSLLNGHKGQVVTIFAGNTSTTIQHNSSILLAGTADFVMSGNDSCTLMFNGTVWNEIARCHH